jgi:hypothetical protein
MPGASGKVLENKRVRDEEIKPSVSSFRRYCAWVYIVVLDVGMLFYIFLFAIQESEANQSAWLQSFLLWLVADFVLVSPVRLINEINK